MTIARKKMTGLCEQHRNSLVAKTKKIDDKKPCWKYKARQKKVN